jgi:hypothetical protein
LQLQSQRGGIVIEAYPYIDATGGTAVVVMDDHVIAGRMHHAQKIADLTPLMLRQVQAYLPLSLNKLASALSESCDKRLIFKQLRVSQQTPISFKGLSSEVR